MAALEKYLFSNEAGEHDKQFAAKRRIVSWLVLAQECAIADAAKALDISIPTATKLIGELIDEGVAVDLGKVETAGGRRPNLFGVRGEGMHLLGAEIGQNKTDLIITDLRGEIIVEETINVPEERAPRTIADFRVRYSETLCLAQNDAVVATPDSSLRTPHLIAAGIALPCRVNPIEGRTFGAFDEDETPFRERMAAQLGITTHIDTAARAACLAERRAALHIEKSPHRVADNMLYINIGHTLTAAVVIDGHPYIGHSGFAGDIWIGLFAEAEFDLRKLIDSARRDDPAAVAQIESAAERAGREIAALVGAFNPEMVVVGGELAQADDYLMLPLQAALHKNTAKIIYRDTRVRTASVTKNAAALGATLLELV